MKNLKFVAKEKKKNFNNYFCMRSIPNIFKELGLSRINLVYHRTSVLIITISFSLQFAECQKPQLIIHCFITTAESRALEIYPSQSYKKHRLCEAEIRVIFVRSVYEVLVTVTVTNGAKMDTGLDCSILVDELFRIVKNDKYSLTKRKTTRIYREIQQYIVKHILVL